MNDFPLVPLFAIVSVFGAPVLVVFLLLRFNLRRQSQQQETIRMFLEAGQAVPEALITKPLRRDNEDRTRGILGIALGLGIAACFLNLDSWDGWGFGAIPFFIGVGYLLSWWLDRRDRRNPAAE